MIKDEPYHCSICKKLIIEHKIAQTQFYCFNIAILCAECVGKLSQYQKDPLVSELIDMLGKEIAIFVDGDDLSKFTKPPDLSLIHISEPTRPY